MKNLHPDEEIRVIALEFASKLMTYDGPPDIDAYLANAAKIEHYISKGSNGR
jgi:hypothetical protein